MMMLVALAVYIYVIVYVKCIVYVACELPIEISLVTIPTTTESHFHSFEAISVTRIFLDCNVLCVQANYNSFFLHKLNLMQ